MRRGEVRLTNFDPAVSTESDKRRPAVIVSNDRANVTAARLGRGVITVVPITSNITRIFPFQVRLPASDSGLHIDSKAHAEQVRSVSIERIGAVLGRLPEWIMAEVDEALRLHLQL